VDVNRKEIERLREEARQREEAERKKREEAARPPTRLVLASPDGVEQAIGARLTLGRIVLAKFGPGAQYAAEHQFILDRAGDDWFVEACHGTPNDTLHNGELLTGRAKLAAGDRIAVGRAASKKVALELTVRFA
jgi:hypothetical protein